MVHFTAAVSKT